MMVEKRRDGCIQLNLESIDKEMRSFEFQKCEWTYRSTEEKKTPFEGTQPVLQVFHVVSFARFCQGIESQA